MSRSHSSALPYDLLFPVLLFAATGAMTWAVRGSSGYGGSWGCVFAGVLWGAAWWYLAQGGDGESRRPYASPWIVLAMVVGFGFSGARGWAQWPNFLEERLYTNAGANEFVPIDRWYGFLWVFIAAVPWAGIAACLLAWCGSTRETRVWHWISRLACGLGAGGLALLLYRWFPGWFLPLFNSLEAQYQDFDANPSLKRLVNDCREAVWHMGIYLGFLVYEIARREVKNVILILTVGLGNGIGWALFQNWKWAPAHWPDGSFNWWRCAESSMGISIGVAYGLAWFLVNRPRSATEEQQVQNRRCITGPNFEWLIVFGLLSWIVAIFVINIDSLQTVGVATFIVVQLTAIAYYLFYRQTYRASEGDTPIPAREFGKYDCPAICYVAALIVAAVLLGGPLWQKGTTHLYGAIVLFTIGPAAMIWYRRQRELFETAQPLNRFPRGDGNIANWGLYLGVALGLAISIRSGLKGWINIYWGNEDYWSDLLWEYFTMLFPVLILALGLWFISRKPTATRKADTERKEYALVWLVLIVQNIFAQLVTGPGSSWTEFAFDAYYVMLFIISGLIVAHIHALRLTHR